MNWDALSAISELAGSFAVLVTLIYLAVQVKQSRDILEDNRKTSLSQVYEARVNLRFRQHELGASREMAAIIVKLRSVASKNPTDRLGALDEIEREQLRNFLSLSIQGLDNSLYQGTLDLLNEKQLERTKQVIRESYPLWQASEAIITPRIRDWFEEDRNDA